jgi:hypothetical protein
MELAAHQSLTDLMSDWSKRQSCGEFMTQKILRLSAKIKNLQWLIIIIIIIIIHLLIGNDNNTHSAGMLGAHRSVLYVSDYLS